MKYVITILLAHWILPVLGQKVIPNLDNYGRVYEERIIEFPAEVKKPYELINFSLFSVFSGLHSTELLLETQEVYLHKITLDLGRNDGLQLEANLAVQVKPGRARIYVSNLIVIQYISSRRPHRTEAEGLVNKINNHLHTPLLTLRELLDQVAVENIPSDW